MSEWRRQAMAGYPMPGVELEIFDTEEKPVPHDGESVGEVVVRADNVMHGYWNSPEETQRAFRNGLFQSGDIGYQDKDGYFYILDRLKDMIVTGGENVYSAEVEAIVCEHPAVREAAVFGIPDPQWGELVAACAASKTIESHIQQSY